MGVRTPIDSETVRAAVKAQVKWLGRNGHTKERNLAKIVEERNPHPVGSAARIVTEALRYELKALAVEKHVPTAELLFQGRDLRSRVRAYVRKLKEADRARASWTDPKKGRSVRPEFLGLGPAGDELLAVLEFILARLEQPRRIKLPLSGQEWSTFRRDTINALVEAGTAVADAEALFPEVGAGDEHRKKARLKKRRQRAQRGRTRTAQQHPPADGPGHPSADPCPPPATREQPPTAVKCSQP